MKSAITRAAEAVEAAEKMFAEETGATLDLSPAAKAALIVKDHRSDPGRRRRKRDSTEQFVR